MRWTLWVGLMAGVAGGAPKEPAQLEAEVSGALLEGDGHRARTLLRHAPGVDDAFRDCVLARLERDVALSPTAVPGPFTRHLLDAYRAAWRAGVMAPGRRHEAEARLLKEVRAMVGRFDAPDLESLERPLAARLEAEGVKALFGRTGLLPELMVWTREERRTESVSLPEGVEEVRVTLLDGFLSRGWGYDLTCGRTGTGGWTTSEGLSLVRPAYQSLDTEDYRVNFLAHEAQHFADQRRFPRLEAWEKEYRAKLVELSLADVTRAEVLLRFATMQGDEPTSPHGYASRRVLRAVRERLGLAPEADLGAEPGLEVRAAALEALAADTASRGHGPLPSAR